MPNNLEPQVIQGSLTGGNAEKASPLLKHPVIPSPGADFLKVDAYFFFFLIYLCCPLIS